MDILNLLTRLLLWLAIGYFLWWVLKKFIPATFLTWLGGAIILALVAASFIAPADRTIGTFWQFLAFPLTPLGLTITLLGVALSKGVAKADGRLVTAALIILLVSSVPLVARTLANQSEEAIQRAFANQRLLCSDICVVPDAVPVDQAVSIVVMGDNADAYQLASSLPSQIDARNRLDPTLVSRLNSAADVYSQISLANPIVTVTAGPLADNTESGQQLEQQIRNLLINRGIPAGNIEVVNTGLGVRATVEQQRDLLRNRGLFTDPVPRNQRDFRQNTNRDARRTVLVAPALTMRRAALAFEKEGLQVVAWPTELITLNLPDTGDAIARLADLVPNVDALKLTTLYWQELLASIYYYLRGWLPTFTVQWEEVVETLQ